MIRTALISLAGLGLAACASTTPYQQAEKAGHTGYSDQMIEADRFRVSFRGNSVTPKDQVENYLLYRAAELTLERGYDYFLVVDRDTEGKSKLQPLGGAPYSSRFGFGYNYYHPAYGWYGAYDPFWDPPTYQEVTRYEATAEIQMRKGDKPADEPRAFAAREVVANLGPTVTRPE